MDEVYREIKTENISIVRSDAQSGRVAIRSGQKQP